MTLIVYSKHNCPNCEHLKARLEVQGIPFKEVNVMEDPASRDFLVAAGHRSVPQMYRDGVHVPDFTK